MNCIVRKREIVRWRDGPLTPSLSFPVQVAVSCALSTREQMYSFVRVLFGVQPLLCSVFVYLQLLISLRATMIAMMTIRITRMMSR